MTKAARLTKIVEGLVDRDQVPLGTIIACATALGRYRIRAYKGMIDIVFDDGSIAMFDDDGDDA